jgi:predicted transcriptional regulator
LEKDVSVKSENTNSEIENIDTTKVIEKEIISTDKAAQVLIGKESDDGGEYSSFTNNFRINDSKILSLLNQEVGSNYYSFTGLMRKLNLHQQSLTRALNRLQDLGLIDRSNMGYKLTKNGISMLSKSSVGPIDKIIKPKEYIQLLQTYIPINVNARDIACSLIGKWFNNLRWTGLIENEMEYMLQWISEDNSFQINLRILTDYIVIETNAISDKEKVEAMVGSCRIFEQIIRILQSKLESVDIHMLNINYNISKQNN